MITFGSMVIAVCRLFPWAFFSNSDDSFEVSNRSGFNCRNDSIIAISEDRSKDGNNGIV